jgi:hypothetical protein
MDVLSWANGVGSSTFQWSPTGPGFVQRASYLSSLIPTCPSIHSDSRKFLIGLTSERLIGMPRNA